MRLRALRFAIVLVALIAVGAAVLAAQQFRRGRRYGAPIRTPTAGSFDGAFNFCRVMFQSSSYGDGGNWSVDYPRADVNLSIRLAELTKTRISVIEGGEPNHLVLRLTDIAFGEPSAAGRPLHGSLAPMYAHVALVLAAGVHLPAPMVAWFQAVAALLG